MGRGLSAQQRRVLGVAYANYQDRAERNREHEATMRSFDAQLRRTQEWGPRVPLPHLTHHAAMLALHGWVSGAITQGDSMRVYADFVGGQFGPAGATPVVATISRAAYEAAHASTTRTLTRLVARGLLATYDYHGGFDLTEAGIAVAAALAGEEEAA
jgi:hypothetical protein